MSTSPAAENINHIFETARCGSKLSVNFNGEARTYQVTLVYNNPDQNLGYGESSRSLVAVRIQDGQKVKDDYIAISEYNRLGQRMLTHAHDEAAFDARLEGTDIAIIDAESGVRRFTYESASEGPNASEIFDTTMGYDPATNEVLVKQSTVSRPEDKTRRMYGRPIRASHITIDLS